MSFFGHSGATPQQVANAILEELRLNLPGVDESNSWITDDPSELGPGPGSDITVTLYVPPSATFDPGDFGGAGERKLTTHVVFVLSVWWAPASGDDTGRAESLLFDESEGVFSVAGRVLRALTGNPLLDRQRQELLLTEPLMPLGMDWARDGEDVGGGNLQISLQAQFVWDLDLTSQLPQAWS